jgi:hypothetical protein
MEKAARFTTAARLTIGGVIGFVPTADSYYPYPAGSHAVAPAAMWRMNPSIQSHLGHPSPSSLI